MIAESLLMYPNYFSSLVGITDSAIKACIVINFAACLTVLWFQFVTFLFLDNLSANEYQAVYQRGWIFFCNSLLFWGTASMKAQINPYNLGIGALAALTLLVLHWICRSRVRALQAFDASSMSFSALFKSVRLAVLCVILAFVDAGMCQLSWEKYGTMGFSLYFSIFTIDLTEMCFVICGELIINIIAVYYLHRHEDEDEWERSRFLTQFVHLVSSIAGMSAHCVVVSRYGIWSSDPGSFLMRSIRAYRNLTSFHKVVTAKSELDRFTTPATEAHLNRDNTCVICRDEMLVEDAAHKRKAAKLLGCGHVMHAGCLGSWLTRSQNCPTCRQPVHSAASSFKTENDAGMMQESEISAAAGIVEQRPSDTANEGRVDGGASQSQVSGPDGALEHLVSRLETPVQHSRAYLKRESTETQANFIVPLGVCMTGENTGMLAERYRFTFNT